MSDLIARTAIEQMNMQPVMADKNQAAQMANNLSLMAAMKAEDIEAQERKVIDQLCAAYGFDAKSQNKPYAYQDGVAVIPIHGTLINRFGGSWGYVTGYNYIQRMRALATADDDVLLIAYDHQSGGGQVAGAFETAKSIFDARAEKPSIAIVDHASYSAAFMQAVAADKIYVVPTGGVGSVGVYTMHVDMSKMLEDWGLKIQFIHSGDNKVDGNPYEPLPDDVRADIQARVDKTRTNFVNLVAEYRGIDADAVRKTEGRCYDAETALQMGLIDGIATPAEAISKFFNDYEKHEEDETMSDKDKAAAAAAAATQATGPAVDENALRAEGAAAERARVSAIMGSEEAKERPTLANHIALNTGMSAADAKGLLAASAKENQAPTKAEETDPLAAAMAKTDQPVVGADKNNGDDKADGVNTLLADYTAVTGRVLN